MHHLLHPACFLQIKYCTKIYLQSTLLTAIISNVSNFEKSKTFWPQKSLITVSIYNKEEQGKLRHNWHSCGIPASIWIISLNIGVSILYATLKCQKKKKNSLLTLMMITAQVARELESIYCLKLLRSASLDISKSPSFVGQDTNHLITQVFAAC